MEETNSITNEQGPARSFSPSNTPELQRKN